MPLRRHSFHPKCQTWLHGVDLLSTLSPLSQPAPDACHRLQSHPIVTPRSPQAASTFPCPRSDRIIYFRLPLPHPLMIPGLPPSSLRSNIQSHSSSWPITSASTALFSQPSLTSAHTYTYYITFNMLSHFSCHIRIIALIICLRIKLQALHYTPSISHCTRPAILSHKANKPPQTYVILEWNCPDFTNKAQRGELTYLKSHSQ